MSASWSGAGDAQGAAAYKLAQEAFVTGLEGSNLLTVVLILLHMPSLILLHKLLRIFPAPPSPHSAPPRCFLLDWLVLVLPTLLSLTVLAPVAPLSLAVLTAANAVLLVRASRGSGSGSGRGREEGSDWRLVLAPFAAYRLSCRQGPAEAAPLTPAAGSERARSGWPPTVPFPALSHFKAGNMLLTCLAILAVDFPAFPRYLAKTERFGVSLMDVGVGTFVVASALTSRFAMRSDAQEGGSTGVAGAGASKVAEAEAEAEAEATHRDADHGSQPSVCETMGHKLDENMGDCGDAAAASARSSAASWRKKARGVLSTYWSSACAAIPALLADSRRVRRLSVLALGVGRLVALRVLLPSYQAHSSEYGLHWNFFVTLYAVWSLSEAADGASALLIPWGEKGRRAGGATVHPAVSKGIAAALLLGVYQALLLSPCSWVLGAGHCATTGLLSDFLLAPHEPTSSTPSASPYTLLSFVYANKEGAASVPGYLALYWLAEAMSRLVLVPAYRGQQRAVQGEVEAEAGGKDGAGASLHDVARGGSATTAKWGLARTLTLGVAASWALWVAVESSVQPTSRRLCNAAFVLYVVFLSTLLLLVLHVVCDSLAWARCAPGAVRDGTAVVQAQQVSSSVLMEHLNTHQLAVFLAANLLTGAVNASVRTIYCGVEAAMGVLVAYSGALVCVVYALMRVSAKPRC